MKLRGFLIQVIIKINAVHAQAEPGGADWDDEEPEAQQEPVEGAGPGGGRGQVSLRFSRRFKAGAPKAREVAALSEGAVEGDFDVPLVGGHYSAVHWLTPT